MNATTTSTSNGNCRRGSLAPFRLGLTATPERTDGGYQQLDRLLGPICYRCEIPELEGRFLASYQAEVLEVLMDPDEAESYAAHRKVYIDFIRSRDRLLHALMGGRVSSHRGSRSSRSRGHGQLSRTKAPHPASRAKLRGCGFVARSRR